MSCQWQVKHFCPGWIQILALKLHLMRDLQTFSDNPFKDYQKMSVQKCKNIHGAYCVYPKSWWRYFSKYFGLGFPLPVTPRPPILWSPVLLCNCLSHHGMHSLYTWAQLPVQWPWHGPSSLLSFPLESNHHGMLEAELPWDSLDIRCLSSLAQVQDVSCHTFFLTLVWNKNFGDPILTPDLSLPRRTQRAKSRSLFYHLPLQEHGQHGRQRGCGCEYDQY